MTETEIHRASNPTGLRPQRPPLGLLTAVLVSLVWLSSPAQAQLYAFVHTATAENTFLDTTGIDDPVVNDDPDAVLIVTQVWNPEGSGLSGVSNPHEIGLSYSSTTGRWSIYNQDFGAMPIGAAFDVWVSPTGMPIPPAIRHTATAGNTLENRTFIGEPLLTACPSAIIQVTHVRNPGGGSGPRNDHPLSVEYDSFTDQWGIRNQDSATMPLGASFDVLLERYCAPAPPVPGKARVESYILGQHVADASNTVGSLTRIDRPFTNDNPDAIVFVTVETTPPTPADPHPIGVIYDVLAGRWAIFNEDDEAMPLGARFNLLIPESLVLFEDGFESGNTSAWSLVAP